MAPSSALKKVLIMPTLFGVPNNVVRSVGEGGMHLIRYLALLCVV